MSKLSKIVAVNSVYYTQPCIFAIYKGKRFGLILEQREQSESMKHQIRKQKTLSGIPEPQGC